MKLRCFMFPLPRIVAEQPLSIPTDVAGDNLGARDRVRGPESEDWIAPHPNPLPKNSDNAKSFDCAYLYEFLGRGD